jgi:hypothetical protein
MGFGRRKSDPGGGTETMAETSKWGNHGNPARGTIPNLRSLMGEPELLLSKFDTMPETSVMGSHGNRFAPDQIANCLLHGNLAPERVTGASEQLPAISILMGRQAERVPRPMARGTVK